MTESPGLTMLHVGAFSGSVPALRRALAAHTAVDAHDLMPLAQAPRLVGARLRAVREARLSAPGTPWTKTAAWTEALDRHVRGRGLLGPDRPVLIVQTLPALVPPAGVRYGVYTDRVGLEGAAVGGVHRSRYTDGWLARERRLLLGAHRVFVMGPSTADVLVTEYGLAADRVHVVGAGPNVDPPTGERAERSADPPRLLFVGTQWELKGGPILLEAFARLHARDPRYRLTLVGSGPAGPVPEGVTALGRIPHAEMGAVYEAADAVVIPTHMEAFGIALVEGLMRGLPCVASVVGNQPWIIGDAGVAVRPGDVDGLVDAIDRLAVGYAEFRKSAIARGDELRSTMAWPAVAEHIVADLT
ncbi:glycosyltransferase family 4 protein [Embleya sp. NBC_00896]|uniref:glycosyltransferase family 4 protein n=1 Tax=Embleya sp. NBC_00896 TaxID=2975961 RepID=UPI00386B0E53|nr:glycosyltransferase family 4 protein [Embleya sp. NBC_00896]